MDKQTALTPFEMELKAILDLPEPDMTFVQGLRTTLLNPPQTKLVQKRNVAMPWGRRQPVWAWTAAAILLVVLTIFFAVGPERVLAAAWHWLSEFVPGAGFIEDHSSLRVLEKPAHVSIDGAAVSVEQGYTNAKGTYIQIHYMDDSRSCKNTNVTWEEYRAGLKEKVYLLLPDGRKLYALTPRFSSWGSFPPLPDGLNEVVLVMPSNVIYSCAVKESANGAAQSTFCQCLDDNQRWLIQLKFVAPPPGSILPVIDSSTPTAYPFSTMAVQSSVPATTAQPLPSEPVVTPVVTAQPELVGKLVSLDDGYLILAALKRDPNGSISYRFGMNERHFKLTDVSGVEIPVAEIDRSEVNPDVFKDFPWGDTLLLRTRTKPVNGPLQLTFPTLVKSQYQPGKEAEFTIDLGANPRSAQQIPFQQTFSFIPGHLFTLREVRVDTQEQNKLGVTLKFEGQGYETIQVDPAPFPDPPPQGGSSGQCADFAGCFYTTTSITRGADNLYHLMVSGVDYQVQGSWSLTFDLSGTKSQ